MPRAGPPHWGGQCWLGGVMVVVGEGTLTWLQTLGRKEEVVPIGIGLGSLMRSNGVATTVGELNPMKPESR